VLETLWSALRAISAPRAAPVSIGVVTGNAPRLTDGGSSVRPAQVNELRGGHRRGAPERGGKGEGTQARFLPRRLFTLLGMRQRALTSTGSNFHYN